MYIYDSDFFFIVNYGNITCYQYTIMFLINVSN